MRRHRRALKSEINVVPFIDVVLVLLIVFMVAMPMAQTGQIKIPSVGNAAQFQTPPLQITLIPKSQQYVYQLSGASAGTQVLSIDRLIRVVAQYQREKPDQSVVIRADKETKYNDVIFVLDQLQRHSIHHVGLLVQPQDRR